MQARYFKCAVILSSAALMLAYCFTYSDAARNILIAKQAAYEKAVEYVKLGDVTKLAGGSWEDFEIVFVAEGQYGHAIRLTAERIGEVIFSGQTNVRPVGDFFDVSGLVFKYSYTPTSEVISFR